jgi:Skp family chaperone for outer membrane proteins
MTMIKKLLLAAALATPATLIATTATAQVSGVAVADPQAAIANSRAWTAARTQIEATYKTQLDQAETRRRAIATELQPLVTAYQTAARAPGATEASLRTQAQTIQSRETAANQELSRLTAPAQRAQAYAIEQIQAQLATATQNAVRARNVTLLLNPQTVLFAQPAADITPAITTELDRLVPTVNTTPPAGWQPGQQGQAGAAPAAGTSAPAPRAGTRQPQGR